VVADATGITQERRRVDGRRSRAAAELLDGYRENPDKGGAVGRPLSTELSPTRSPAAIRMVDQLPRARPPARRVDALLASSTRWSRLHKLLEVTEDCICISGCRPQAAAPPGESGRKRRASPGTG